MAYEQKDGEGSLFANSFKETEQQPDMTGTITISGKAYRLAGWKKTKRDGEAYYSLSARPDVPRAPKAPEAPPPLPAPVRDFDDSLDTPF